MISTNIERNIKSKKLYTKKLGYYGGNVSKLKDYAFKNESAIFFYQTLYIAGVY